MSKGRILFLHGFAQSSSIFYAKTSALRKRLIKLGYTPVYLNAPLQLTPAQFPSTDSLSKFSTVVAAEGEETNYRAWWVRPSQESQEVNLDAAIDAVKRYIETGEIIPDKDEEVKDEEKEEKTKDTTPIVGIIGFSQGAGFSGILARKFQQLFDVDEPLQFVIAYCGFKVDDPTHEHFYSLPKDKDSFRMLHVIGELDTLVDEDRAMKLYHPYKDVSDVMKHPGGHFVPNSKLLIDQIVGWLQQPAKEEKKKEDASVDDLLAMMDGFGA